MRLDGKKFVQARWVRFLECASERDAPDKRCEQLVGLKNKRKTKRSAGKKYDFSWGERPEQLPEAKKPKQVAVALHNKRSTLTDGNDQIIKLSKIIATTPPK